MSTPVLAQKESAQAGLGTLSANKKSPLCYQRASHLPYKPANYFRSAFN
jgi:hypothetical protein